MSVVDESVGKAFLRLCDEVEHLSAERDRLQAERDRACLLLSRRSWEGRLDMSDEWHVERGRTLAGFVGRGDS